MHTPKLSFYEFISLKIYFDSCLQHADWGVVFLSWKAVERDALVLFFFLRLSKWCVKSLFSPDWYCLWESSEPWKISARLLIVDHAGSHLRVMWVIAALCERFENMAGMREICWNREVWGGKHLVHRRKGQGLWEFAVWPIWSNYLSFSSDNVQICETVKHVKEHSM